MTTESAVNDLLDDAAIHIWGPAIIAAMKAFDRTPDGVESILMNAERLIDATTIVVVYDDGVKIELRQAPLQ